MMDALHHIHSTLVKNAIKGTVGNPNWAAILQLINSLERVPEGTSTVIDIFAQKVTTGNFAVKYNSILVLDALFKNCKKEQLKELQCQQLYSMLNNPAVLNDPIIHNYLCKNLSAWEIACQENNCLKREFSNFKSQFCAFRFVPEITPQLRHKFREDFEVGGNICVLFGQCLITSFAENNSPTDPTLVEIYENVREIRNRLDQLKNDIADKELKSKMLRLLDLSNIDIAMYSAFKNKGAFNCQALMKAITKYQGAQLEQPKNEEDEENDPNAELDEKEFFAKLDEIKKKRSAKAVEAPQTDLLIDF